MLIPQLRYDTVVVNGWKTPYADVISGVTRLSGVVKYSMTNYMATASFSEEIEKCGLASYDDDESGVVMKGTRIPPDDGPPAGVDGKDSCQRSSIA